MGGWAMGRVSVIAVEGILVPATGRQVTRRRRRQMVPVMEGWGMAVEMGVSLTG